MLALSKLGTISLVKIPKEDNTSIQNINTNVFVNMENMDKPAKKVRIEIIYLLTRVGLSKYVFHLCLSNLGCDCDPHLSVSDECNGEGKCTCRSDIIVGDKCNQCKMEIWDTAKNCTGCIANKFNYPDCEGKSLYFDKNQYFKDVLMKFF